MRVHIDFGETYAPVARLEIVRLLLAYVVEAMLSKFILMMPKTQVKNQESSKFQESKNRSIKNQDSSEDSREDSRYARTSRKASR